MATGILEFTIVSATISQHARFDFEPTDTYATIRCIKEQRCTKTARDQGRLPAWNETFTFHLQEGDLSKDILVQVFGVKSESDELLGLARIPIVTAVGKGEGTVCSLNCPNIGEIGKLKAAWTWKPNSQGLRDLDPQLKLPGMPAIGSGYDSATIDPSVPWEGDYGSVTYPGVQSKTQGTSGEDTFNDINSTMARLTIDKEYSGKAMPSAPPFAEAGFGSRGSVETYYEGGAYPPTSYGASPFVSYPPTKMEHSSSVYPNQTSQVYSGYPDVKVLAPGEGKDSRKGPGTYTSAVYPSFKESSEYNYPPHPDVIPVYPQSADAYPSYPDYPGVASSAEHAKIPTEKEGETSTYTTRGIGKTKEKGKGHTSDIPYSYPPPVHGAYPPTPYPAPPGYPPAYDPPYSHPPGGYPPAPAYPPAPHGYPPAPHGYPPAPHGYPPAGYPPAPDHHPAPAYPPYGYPPPVHGIPQHAPYPMAHGHGSGYATGAYVDHSSHTKHEKHHKHSKHKGGHFQPHYRAHDHHHKHKKH